MIEISNLSKSFDNKNYVLENLNCKIKDNAIYGLVGANGAGKSTLLRLINSIYTANEGKILIDNQNAYDNETLKQEMVFVPDDLYFYPGYTLMDMAEYHKSLYHNFDMNFVINTANTLKLNPNVKISNFSKGMKRQCALICALATNAKYLFFDETFDGLDPVVRNYFKKLLSDAMSKKDTTIIMTSHNLRELEDICDSFGILDNGCMTTSGDLYDIKDHIHKIQLAFKEELNKEEFSHLDVLSFHKQSRVINMVVKGDIEKIKDYLRMFNPIMLEVLPVNLEEIFIYEMERKGYGVYD